MAIKLDDELKTSAQKTLKVEKSINVDEKVKIKFNTSTIMITNAELFNTPMTEEDEKKARVTFYPSGTSYRHFKYGQVLEVSKPEYENIKAYFANRMVYVNNERMGNLGNLYKERLATASPSEREYIKLNEHEFTAAVFEKPIIELVS